LARGHAFGIKWQAACHGRVYAGRVLLEDRVILGMLLALSPFTRSKCREYPEELMLHPVTTTFLARLKASDQAAWFELWQTFGPVLRAQLLKWGHGRIGAETAADLSQETLAELTESINRFDPSRGVRFSTWLLSIAKHVLGDELDKRSAMKRGGGGAGTHVGKKQSLDENWMIADNAPPVDAQYEAAVFRAKVKAALAQVARESDFQDFAVFRMRVLEGQSGKDVASALGTSEPTVSRRAAKVREQLRVTLATTIAAYSFTDEERSELARQGLAEGTPGDPASDAAFDAALCDVYHALVEQERAMAAQAPSNSGIKSPGTSNPRKGDA
jgi:RNA polymerase sigma factor (sigma-70 family)